MKWPVTLSEGAVTLRGLRYRDAGAWREIRTRNAAWLRPWEGTLPIVRQADADVPATFGQMVRRQRLEARQGRALPWAITVDGRLAGQLTVGGITYGSLRGGHVGYWIDERVAGRGIMPMAVAMACDYCFDVLELHRLEINIRPENTASRRVVEKLGLRNEGLSPSYLHIDGDWRDHMRFAVVAGEFPMGLLTHLRATRHAERE